MKLESGEKLVASGVQVGVAPSALVNCTWMDGRVSASATGRGSVNRHLYL